MYDNWKELGYKSKEDQQWWVRRTMLRTEVKALVTAKHAVEGYDAFKELMIFAKFIGIRIYQCLIKKIFFTSNIDNYYHTPKDSFFKKLKDLDGDDISFSEKLQVYEEVGLLLGRNVVIARTKSDLDSLENIMAAAENISNMVTAHFMLILIGMDNTTERATIINGLNSIYDIYIRAIEDYRSSHNIAISNLDNPEKDKS